MPTEKRIWDGVDTWVGKGVSSVAPVVAPDGGLGTGQLGTMPLGGAE